MEVEAEVGAEVEVLVLVLVLVLGPVYDAGSSRCLAVEI